MRHANAKSPCGLGSKRHQFGSKEIGCRGTLLRPETPHQGSPLLMAYRPGPCRKRREAGSGRREDATKSFGTTISDGQGRSYHAPSYVAICRPSVIGASLHRTCTNCMCDNEDGKPTWTSESTGPVLGNGSEARARAPPLGRRWRRTATARVLGSLVLANCHGAHGDDAATAPPDKRK